MATVTMHMINNDVGAQTIKTRAGDVFTLGAYLYPKAGNTGGGTVKLNLHCTNSTGSPAATDVSVTSETTPATGSWTYLTGNATVPANYDTVDPQIVLTSVPVTDYIYFDDILVRETTAAQNVLDTLWQNITGLTTANNTTSALGTQVANWINKLFGTTSVQTAITATAVPGIDASKVTSGSFAQSMVTGLATSLSSLLPTTTYQNLLDDIANAMGQSGTGHTLAQVETYLGLIPGPNIATAVNAAVVPGLDGSKITSGSIAQSFLSITSLAASILTGNISSNVLPQVVGGQTSANMVLDPDFEATTLWTGATGSQTTAQAHSGTHSWQLQGAG